MTIPFKRLVHTIIFDDIETDADTDFAFRLEVYQDQSNVVTGQLYRREMYKFTCSFEDFTPDESIYVLDHHTIADLDDKTFGHVDECLSYVIKSLQHMFCLE